MSLDRAWKVSPHFTIGELVPADCESVPQEILEELQELCQTLLEPVRLRLSLPVAIHDAWRPAPHNAVVGGVKTSDHLTGHACDFHVLQGNGKTWVNNTLEAFDYIRKDLEGTFGQVILEDHRRITGLEGKLWVHVSTPTSKHPGTSGDVSAVLFSSRPGRYTRYSGNQT